MKPKPEITADNVKTVQDSFVLASLNPKVRPDAEQTAWQYLLSRNTNWRKPETLRSQSRNAIADSRRTLARRYNIDRQITLLALQDLDGMPSAPLERMPSPDDETLCTYARCLVCAMAIRNVRVYRRSFSADYFELLKSTACDMALTSGRVPSAQQAAEELQERELSDFLQSLASR